MIYLLEALFILAPTYVWRFRLGPVPLNVLEILIFGFWAVFAIWLWRKRQWAEFWQAIRADHPKILRWSAGFFLGAGIISALISPAHQRAAGLFVAYFLQPIITYFLAAYILRRPQAKDHFIKVVFLMVGIYGVYAVIQYYTLIGVPPQWWGNSVEPKRALAVFEYPNAFALWLTPLLAFGLPFFFDREFKPAPYKIFYALGFGGLLFNLSRGGWAGFLAAAALFALSYQNKKVLKYLTMLLIPLVVVVYLLPNLRYRLILPFKGDKSTLSRFSLWHTADSMLKSSPILGKGLYGFRTLYDKFNTDALTPAYDYPHNIFLNFWVETGLLGLLSFLVLCGSVFWRGLRNKASPYQLGIALFILAMFVHGLIDVPYFLNVLALEFWLMLALANSMPGSVAAPAQSN